MNCCEAHVLGKGDRFLWYVFNWGGGKHEVSIAMEGAPDGDYKVRDVVSKREVYGATVSAASLRKGLPLKIESQFPSILLFEKAELPQLTLKPLPDSQKRFIDMWRPSPKAQTRVLVGSAMGETVFKSRMLTGVNLLEDQGFELNISLDPIKPVLKTYTDKAAFERLEDYQILTSLGSEIGDNKFWSKENAETARQFVENGGGLLIALNQVEGPHNWLTNWAKNELLKEFGLTPSDQNVIDKSHYFFTPEFPAFSDIVLHEVTKGVASFQSEGMSVLRGGQKTGAPLIVSSKDASPANVGVLYAFEYGKGRVVVMGDAKWMEPECLAKADNAQLLLNIFNWLAKREVKLVDKETLSRKVDCDFQ